MRKSIFTMSKGNSGGGKSSNSGKGGQGGGRPSPPSGSGGYPSTTGNISGGGRFNAPSK